MSWTTGTQTEALSCANVNGTALSNSTTAAIISPAEGAAYTPANFWLPTYGSSKGLLVKAHGVISTTATPSITIEVDFDTTQGTRNASGIVATTGSVALVASGTNMPWELEVLITNVTTGPTATFLADGIFKTYDTATTLHAYRISSSAANPNTAFAFGSGGTQSAYYIELSGTWSAASASNSIQVYAYSVLGLN